MQFCWIEDGVLSLKSELWQSRGTVNKYLNFVLLSLKSELWQSNSVVDNFF